MPRLAFDIGHLDNLAAGGCETAVVVERGALCFGIREEIHAETVSERHAWKNGNVIVAGAGNRHVHGRSGGPDHFL